MSLLHHWWRREEGRWREGEARRQVGVLLAGVWELGGGREGEDRGRNGGTRDQAEGGIENGNSKLPFCGLSCVGVFGGAREIAWK